MTLEEATFDDIFKELVKRFPVGLLIAGLKPHEGDAGEQAVMEDEPTIARSGGYACVGLCEVVKKKIVRDLSKGLVNRKPDAEFADEDDS